jgi:hypothetical protein
MLKVGALVACFYIWSNGQMAPINPNSSSSSDEKPNVMIGKVKEIHQVKKQIFDLSQDNPSLSIKTEDQTLIEVESKKERMLYFINLAACKIEPSEEELSKLLITENLEQKKPPADASINPEETVKKSAQKNEQESLKPKNNDESVVNEFGSHIKEGLGL